MENVANPDKSAYPFCHNGGSDGISDGLTKQEKAKLQLFSTLTAATFPVPGTNGKLNLGMVDEWRKSVAPTLDKIAGEWAEKIMR